MLVSGLLQFFEFDAVELIAGDRLSFGKSWMGAHIFVFPFGEEGV